MPPEDKPAWSRSICILMAFGLLFFVSSAFIQTNFIRGQSSNLVSTENGYPLPQTQTLDADYYENNTVYIGLWLNNIYSYQYLAGEYTLDMYLYFFWVDPNIATIDWYLMNGYPVNPATTILVSSNLTSEVKNEIYRVTAVCNTAPDAKDFPFDSIQLQVAIELLIHGYPTQLVWLENETGIDSGFVNARWVTTGINLTVSEHDYPLDVVLPRAEMVVTQERERPSAGIQSLITPAIFGIVSAFSFLFSLKDTGAVGLRLGLNTSMLVTTLLFNFAVSSIIPPASTIVLYSLFMLSILLFMVMNLIVTITGFVFWFYFKDEKRTKKVNRWGFLFSLLVPAVFFALLYIFRV